MGGHTMLTHGRHKISITEKTHWKAEGAAEEAGRVAPWATHPSESQHRSTALQSPRTVTAKQLESNFVDLSFLDEIPTGLELLEECDILYVREVLLSPTSTASMAEKFRKEKAFEILDHNGERLYFVVTRKKLTSPFMALSWYDFFGNEVLKTSGRFGLWDCSGRLEIQVPSEHTDDDLNDGYIKQACRIRPTYNFSTVDDINYRFVAHKNQWVCCSKGTHAPHDFEILDPEFSDLVGTIYKIQGNLEFGYVDFHPKDKTPTFQGFGVQFMSQEMGVQMKAMMVCGGFLLNKQHFQRQHCCGCHFGCLAALIFLLLILLIIAIGLFGLSSYFSGNQLAEHADEQPLRKVERVDGRGYLALVDSSAKK